MAFTYDLSTDLGKVRLTIADTSATAYSFEDAELSYWLTLTGTVKGAAYHAVQALIASKALRVKRASAGDVDYDDTAQIKALEALADRLAAESGEGLPLVQVANGPTLPMDTGYDEVEA